MRAIVAITCALALAAAAGAVVAAGQQPAAPVSGQQAAQPPEAFPIWPEGVPGAIKNGGPETLDQGLVRNVHEPSLTPYLPPPGRANGTAVIVCPGGGYTVLAIDKEGRAVADWLNTLGISAFVLKYRLKEYGHPAPLRDVLRAVRLLRSEAAKWSIRPDRIGVIGFSAGGHLAASAATMFDAPEGRTGAPLDRLSARPDFAILVYPVVSLVGSFTHTGSRNALLGKDADRALLEKYSNELQVTARTPPTFLIHAKDDPVKVDNSLLFAEALKKAGVPVTLQLYDKGGHGYGLGIHGGDVAQWPARCAEWMKELKLVN